MKSLKRFFEPKLFGVCTAIADRFSMPLSLVRLFFIYLTFITFLSPVIFYLTLAFFMRFKEFFSSGRKTLRDL